MKGSIWVGLVALFGAAAANAQDIPKFYVGAGAGQSTIEAADFGLSFDASATAFKVFGGYNFTPYIGAEVAYLDTGSAEDRIFGVNVEASGTAFQFSLLPTLPVSESVSLYARLAMLAWNLDLAASQGVNSATASDDGNDFSWGVGASFTRNAFGFRLEYEKAEIEDTTFSQITGSLLLRF